MLRQTLIGLGSAIALASAPAAHAGDVWWSVSVGVPGVAFDVAPPIVYAPPPPMVYAPPIVYAPRPVVVAPPPVVYRAPPPPAVVYAGYPYGYGYYTPVARPGWKTHPYRHGWNRGWHHGHHDDD
ncbi:MAG: glutelin [Thiomonas delicata]